MSGDWRGCPQCRFYHPGHKDAMCLGCGRTFSLCPEHWSTFTSCSKECSEKHRKAMRGELVKPIRRGSSL